MNSLDQWKAEIDLIIIDNIMQLGISNFDTSWEIPLPPSRS